MFVTRLQISRVRSVENDQFSRVYIYIYIYVGCWSHIFEHDSLVRVTRIGRGRLSKNISFFRNNLRSRRIVIEDNGILREKIYWETRIIII